ncbi:hypothetical protein D3C75_594120 [compost metagenome]
MLKDDVVDFQAAAAHTLLDVLGGVDCASDHVNLGFQAHARHAQRLAHAFLVVDHVVLRQGVQHALVGRDGNGLGGVEYALQVGQADFAVADGDDAVGVQAADVVAGHADEGRVDTAAGHQLRFFHGALDRLHGGLDVHHHAFFQATGRMGADPDDFQGAVFAHFAHQRHHLGGADIQPDDHFAAMRVCHGPASL